MTISLPICAPILDQRRSSENCDPDAKTPNRARRTPKARAPIIFIYGTRRREDSSHHDNSECRLGQCAISTSRLLKKSFASTGKDGVVAVVEGQLNLDRAVVLEFG